MASLPKPPDNVSEVPDEYTRTAPGYNDYTGDSADNRVFLLSTKFFRYGTDDKAHAAALVLSLSLLTMTLILVVIGAFLDDRTFVAEVLKWVGSAFLMVAGVAIGKSVGNGAGKESAKPKQPD